LPFVRAVSSPDPGQSMTNARGRIVLAGADHNCWHSTVDEQANSQRRGERCCSIGKAATAPRSRAAAPLRGPPSLAFRHPGVRQLDAACPQGPIDLDVDVRPARAPGKGQAPASRLRQVDVGRIDLARRRIHRPADPYHLRGVGEGSRSDRERVAATREPDDPQHLVRGALRMPGAQPRRKEECAGRVARCERVRHREARARVRPRGRGPRGRGTAVKVSRHTPGPGAGVSTGGSGGNGKGGGRARCRVSRSAAAGADGRRRECHRAACRVEQTRIRCYTSGAEPVPVSWNRSPTCGVHRQCGRGNPEPGGWACAREPEHDRLDSLR